MTERLSSLAQNAIDEALGLSRYRVDVHECDHFWTCCGFVPANR